MKIIESDSSLGKSPGESKKRKRELFAIIGLGLVFLILSGVAFRLFSYSRDLPFEYSIFFFGLVNFNVILFLLLLFLIFRNIVKVFAERPGGVIGSSLKSKLIAAFVGFSFIPTTLMFLISVFYINSSFDKWFNEKTTSVLKSSLEVTNTYYVDAKKKNYHFAQQIGKEIQSINNKKDLQDKLQALLKTYRLDAVEFYPGMFGDRIVVYSQDGTIPGVPEISIELRQKGVKKKLESSMIHHFEKGNLIRVIVPVRAMNTGSAIVVSTFVPLSLIAKMDNIAAAYEDYKDTNPLSYPLKSIYLIILVLMTLVILLGATWFGFYLAKQLSIPLELTAKAAEKVAQGDYYRVNVKTGSPEVRLLVDNFNLMSENLERSDKEIKEANINLRKTLARLDEHSRYIEVVLSNITTGVVSVNNRGVITMINRHAAKLLKTEPAKYEGKTVKEVLSSKYNEIFETLISTLKEHKATSIQKEIRVDIKGRSVPLQMNLSILTDERGRELGKILVFDDLSMLVNAQRAAAWNEVARRIAHEIKNPLTPISLSAQRLQKKFSADILDPAFLDCTNMIIDQVDGLKKLVNEFSNFARMPKSSPAMNNLNKVVAAATLLFQQSDKTIDITFKKDKNLPDFLFDADQIKRAITNLIDNAIAASEGEEKAVISLETEFNSLLKIVRIIVADQGSGISKKLLDRVFEPYVTTKKQGTGLGLAIVKRTVEDHSGFIRAFANHPRGSKIVIELPVIVADTTSLMVKTIDAKGKKKDTSPVV